MKNRLSDFYLFLIFGTLFLGLSACSHHNKFPNSDRVPANEQASSLVANDSCKQLIAPLVDESFVLARGDWDPEGLARQDKLDLDTLDSLKAEPEWQRFIARTDQSDEERDMAFVILSLMRKRFPDIPEDRLKDRYKVFMAFCGA
ncbi:MAG: hypothetical protein NXH75_05690 [Halobacteriovoraceae bacterium]|nr:hypothetical protein [Halobacteriovoraceae bacterium]